MNSTNTDPFYDLNADAKLLGPKWHIVGGPPHGYALYEGDRLDRDYMTTDEAFARIQELLDQRAK